MKKWWRLLILNLKKKTLKSGKTFEKSNAFQRQLKKLH